MSKERILIVEDDPNWASNFKRWLGSEYGIDIAITAGIAIDMLRTRDYSLVLLDLSLHPTDSQDRTSEEVQIYLKNISAGTKHIIISGHAVKEDIRKSTIQYKASDVFFKDEFEDIIPFLESVKSAILESKKEVPNSTKAAYEIFCGSGERNVVEFNIIRQLKPEKGINGWFFFKESFFESISPICNHVTRKGIVFVGNCILGLFWSRKLGTAISICLANSEISEEECLKGIETWLGWSHAKGKKHELNNIQGYIFVEPDLSPEDFNLQ